MPALIARYIDDNKFQTEICYTQERGHATTLAQEAVYNKVDVVCAVGGDGSVHEIGKALVVVQRP